MELKERASLALYSFIQRIYLSLGYLVYKSVISPIRYVLLSISSLVEQAFHKAKSTSEKLLLGSVILLSLLWISVISYASFYSLYLPTAAISRPVHLSFSVCDGGVGICSFPSANVSLTNNSPIKEVLGSGQVYSVAIDMEIPDSLVNRDLGMFMVVLHMHDRSHHVSASSKRSALYKYRSLPMRILRLTVLSPLYFLEFYEEKQVISVEMFSSFTDDAYHPSVGATVEIQNHKIQIYSCQLKFYAKFSGLKYILHFWPVTSAVFGISFNITVVFILFAFTFITKRQTIRDMTTSLSIENVPTDNNSPEVSEQEESKKSSGTQTKSKEEDDAETYDLPLVQEPADFGDVLEDNDSELLAELRLRRVQ